jgi:hypothetical protein
VIGAAAQLLADKWSAARRSWRRADAGALATQVLRRTLRPVAVWQKLIFFEKDLADDIPEIRARIPLEMHVVNGDELPAHRAAIEAEGVDWEKMAARAALGHRCTIVLSEGRLVHIRWHTDVGAWIPELRATLRPGPGEAYVYDSFTPEDLRGGQVQPAVSCLMMAWGRQHGYPDRGRALPPLEGRTPGLDHRPAAERVSAPRLRPGRACPFPGAAGTLDQRAALRGAR